MAYPYKGVPMGLQICAYSNKSLIYLSVLHFLLYCLLLICFPFFWAVSTFFSLTPLLFPSHPAPSLCFSVYISLSQKTTKAKIVSSNKRKQPYMLACGPSLQMQFSKIIAVYNVNTIEHFFI